MLGTVLQELPTDAASQLAFTDFCQLSVQVVLQQVGSVLIDAGDRQVFVEDRCVDRLHVAGDGVAVLEFHERCDPPQVVRAVTRPAGTQTIALVHVAMSQFATDGRTQTVADLHVPEVGQQRLVECSLQPARTGVTLATGRPAGTTRSGFRHARGERSRLSEDVVDRFQCRLNSSVRLRRLLWLICPGRSGHTSCSGKKSGDKEFFREARHRMEAPRFG